MSEQISDQVRDQVTGKILPGRSGNVHGRASRKARILAEAERLASQFGGLDTLQPLDRALVMQAATVSLARPTAPSEQTRVANTLARIVALLERRIGKRGRSSGFGRLLEAKP